MGDRFYDFHVIATDNLYTSTNNYYLLYKKSQRGIWHKKCGQQPSSCRPRPGAYHKKDMRPSYCPLPSRPAAKWKRVLTAAPVAPAV